MTAAVLILLGAALPRAALGADGDTPTVLAPHRIQIVVPPGWSWNEGSFSHVGGARATIEVSEATAGGVDARYCEMQVDMAQLDITANSREGDVPEDLGPPPASGWPAWLPVNDGRDIMTCGRVALPRPADASAVDVLTRKYGARDIKVVLTGRDLAAGNALVAALARAQPAGAKPPPRAPTTLHLPVFDVDLQLPDDGMTWSFSGTIDNEMLPGVTLDRLAPADPPLIVGIQSATRDGTRLKSCAQLATDFPETTPLAGLPAGWRHYANPNPNTLSTLACIDLDATLVVVALVASEPVVDAAPFAPLLQAIEAALRPPVKEAPPTDWSSYSSYDESILMASWNLEVPVSWRDSKDDAIPSLRADFPGYETSWLIAASSGFVHRGNIAAAVDLVGVFSDDVTLSPRFGGQHVEMGLDFGFSFELGDATRLGFTAGWQGVVGPLTKNSSIALSAIFASVIERGFGYSVPVTPVQLFAANERELLSPLTVDVRAQLGLLALGLEVQYIGAPEKGDQDIPAEGLAFILRFGVGLGGTH